MRLAFGVGEPDAETPHNIGLVRYDAETLGGVTRGQVLLCNLRLGKGVV